MKVWVIHTYKSQGEAEEIFPTQVLQLGRQEGDYRGGGGQAGQPLVEIIRDVTSSYYCTSLNISK